MINGFLSKRINITEDLAIFQVTPSSPFAPGQFVALGLNNVKRAYSIASTPNDPYYEFLIRRKSNGEFTPKLFDLPVGSSLSISAPSGRFTLKRAPKGTKNLILVASGTGIAPYLSMIRSGIQQKVTVIHGVRYSEDLAYRKYLESVNIRYLPAISSKGIHVQDIFENINTTTQDTELFLCGNPNMIEEMTRLASKQGFILFKKKNKDVPGQIHIERYS